MDVNKKSQTEPQLINNENKPWYKKKNTIIASSSILGIGVLATIITIPIAITSINTSANPILPLTPAVDIKETNLLLNTVDNKETRIIVWDSYISSLIPITYSANTFSLDTIIRDDMFINQFIDFLTDNLNVTTSTTVNTGEISQQDVDNIKATLLEPTNKALFKNATLAVYTDLFNFKTTTPTAPMFSFKDKSTGETIDISLSMPLAGLDLIYNDDGTVSLKIINSSTDTDNIQLTITKFTNPSIATAKNIYFKANAIIPLPSAIMLEFPLYMADLIRTERIDRNDAQITFSVIKKIITDDLSRTKGLTYWNSFALNYAISNSAFLKTELAKEINVGSLYTFLKSNAKNNNSPIEDADLNAIKALAPTANEFNLSINPFVNSPAYSDLLFNTTKANSDNYSLELSITNFNFDFKINNLFMGEKAINIIPKLELSGKLIKKSNGNNNTTTTYAINKALYDVSGLVNLSPYKNSLTGGLAGFFWELQDFTLPTTNLINGLVVLNSKPISEQITFWNSFTTNTTNKIALRDELKKTGVLSNFIISNIDQTNLMGINANSGSLPTITTNTFKTSIDSAVGGTDFTEANLSFTTNNTIAITLRPTTGILYGTDSTNDKFESVTIYFGSEANSISNFNVTSTSTNSNVTFSQTVGSTTFSDKASVTNAASKRVSIIFEKTTTGSSNTSTTVAYFGQYKSTGQNPSQLTKPIVIKNNILTLATKFIESIETVGIV